MVEYNYGYVGKAGEAIAKAQAYDIDVSYKDMCEVCSDVRGTLAEPALTRLTLVAQGKAAVRYTDRHGKRLGHRRELGGRKGRWPKKAARLVHKVLENALANANAKGIQVPFIAHISANKHRTFPRLAPKGRQMRHNYETARIEIVLTESAVTRSEASKVEPKTLKVKTEAEKMAKKAEKVEKAEKKRKKAAWMAREQKVDVSKEADSKTKATMA